MPQRRTPIHAHAVIADPLRSVLTPDGGLYDAAAFVTPVFSFAVVGDSGRPIAVSICRMRDTGEYVVCGPDDVAMDDYPELLRRVVQRLPGDQNSVLALAADLAVDSAEVLA